MNLLKTLARTLTMPDGREPGNRTFTLKDIPSGHPMFKLDELELEGGKALKNLCDICRSAGGDQSGEDKTQPFSATRYVCAMNTLADMAQERTAFREIILPSVVKMHKEAPQESYHLYTNTTLRVQRLVRDGADQHRQQLLLTSG